MPGGDEKLRGPFQERRRVQVPLVQEAWHEFFPSANPLTAANAKQMLTYCDDYAEDVFEHLRDMSGRELQNPLSYILAVMRNTREKLQGAVSAPSSQRGQSTAAAPSTDGPVVEHHWSAAEKADWERRQKMAVEIGLREGWYVPKEASE